MEKKYKVYRVYRNSGRKIIIERNLSREMAMAMVKAFPDSEKSMVVFTKQ